MLTINRPEIIKSSTGMRLQAEFFMGDTSNALWFEVDDKYAEFLTVERADAFLVGLLVKAINEGHDIKVNGPLSERLYFTITNYLIPFIATTYKSKPIKLYCSNLISETLDSYGAVGTGLSCGVDSFSTIYEHLKDDCPKRYQISHLTYFNVGSHGSHGGEKSRNLFNKRLQKVRQCARDLEKDLIVIDSNLSELLAMEFAGMHTIRNMSAVLVMQKLFKVYYYSSSVPFKDLSTEKGMGSYDIFSLNMLSTESVELFSSCATMTRLEKTKMIASMPLVQKHLNVCIKDGYNCGKCVKCARTLLTLEVIGELEHFSEVFHLKAYYNIKSRYMISVLARRKASVFKQEIYEEMRLTKFKIPLHLNVLGRIATLKIRSSELINNLKLSG